MKKTRNVVRKDLWRVAWPLALWAVIVVIEQAFVWKQLWFAPIDSRTLLRVLQVLSGLEFGVTFLIAAAIVQQDRLVGTNAWWLTRPVSRGRLFVAKALAVGIACIALPVIARLPLWSLLHFEPRDLAWAIAEVAAKQFLVVLPAVAVASLTDNLGRFVVWSMVLAFVILTGPVLWGGMALFNIPNGNALQQSRAVVELAILVLTGVAVIVTQYSFRRVAASVLVLASGLAATAMVAPRWTIDLRDLLLTNGRPRDVHPELAHDVALKIRSVQFDPSRWIDPVVNFDVPGVPSGTQWSADPIEHTLQWPAGITLQGNGSLDDRRWNDGFLRLTLGLSAASPDPETEAWYADRLARLRAKRLLWRHDAVPMISEARATIPLRSGIAALVPQQRPAYTFAADIHLVRPTLALELPLKSGAWTTGGGYSVHIVEVRRAPDPVNRQTEDFGRRQEFTTNTLIGAPVLLRDRMFTSGRPQPWFNGQNVTRRTAVAGYVVDRPGNCLAGLLTSEDFQRMDVVVDCIGLSRSRHGAIEVMNRRGQAWVPVDPDFMQNAKLAIVVFPEFARVWREARIEHLTFDENP